MNKIPRHVGYDVYFFDTNKLKSLKCRVCNTECKVNKNQLMATSYAESVCGKQHLTDEFVCPNYTQEWHIRKKMKLIEKDNKRVMEGLYGL